MAETIVSPVLATKELAYATYETLLELHCILSAFNELERPPAWVFGIERMVSRSLDLADRSHCSVLRIPGAMPDTLREPLSSENDGDPSRAE